MMRALDAYAIRAATPWPGLIAAIAAALAEDAVTAPERHVHQVGLPVAAARAAPVASPLQQSISLGHRR